jgi:hypothetical protein
MSKKITLGSSQYTLSTQGDPAGWGEEQSDLIEAIVDSINGFFGPGDILPVSSLIENDTPDFKPVPSLQFNSALVRFAEINYTIIRTSRIQLLPIVNNVIYEVGKIFTLNDPNTGTWALNVQNVSGNGEELPGVFVDAPTSGEVGSAGVEFRINSFGQVEYKSREMSGDYQNNESYINFSAKAIVKERIV